MSTSAVLREAWSAVEEAGLPESIHEVAFREAVRLIAPPAAAAQPARGRQIGHAGASNAGAPTSGGGPAAVGDRLTENVITLSENQLVQKVSNGTGADADALESLIYLDDGALRLSLPGIKLGNNNADRTRTIAAIFTVVRSFGLDEDDTSVELVREEAQRLKCYDSANFASQLKALQGFVIKGAGNNRRIQVKGPGISGFSNLVTRLTGES